MDRVRCVKQAVRLYAGILAVLLVTCCVLTFHCFGQSNASYTIDTVIGDNPLGDGGPASSALLSRPVALAISGEPYRYLYVSDFENWRVRFVSASDKIYTRWRNEQAYSLTFGSDGTLYLGLSGKITAIPSEGDVWTIGGGGDSGGIYGLAAAENISLGVVAGIAAADDGSIYFSDATNHIVSRLKPDGVIEIVAGIPQSLGYSGDNGPAIEAQLNNPQQLALDSTGTLYVADLGNRRIRSLSPDGIINTIAGNGLYGPPQPGGVASASPMGLVAAVAIDALDNVYFTDSRFHQLLRVTRGGILERVAGTGERGLEGDGGPAGAALLDTPQGLAVDSVGEVYVADSGNDRVRKVYLDGHIDTIAGRSHFGGDNGPATEALLNRPESAAVTEEGIVFIADTKNHRIRKAIPGGVITTVAGTGEPGFSGDGMSATVAHLESPGQTTLDSAGNLYFSDSLNRRVRRIGADGIIETVAGTGVEGDSGDGGPATLSTFRAIRGLAVGTDGALYVSDCGSHRIRRVSPDGIIAGFAGTGESGFNGDGGPAREATLKCPGALAMSQGGTLYVLDTGNLRVRSITSEENIATVAGNGKPQNALLTGDDALNVGLPELKGLAIDNEGNLFLSGSMTGGPYSVSHSIYKVEPDGRIWTIAGWYTNSGYDGDGGPAWLADMQEPSGLATDSAGRVYVADTLNHRIRVLTPNPVRSIEIVSGNNQTGTVGVALPERLVLKVTDAQGLPVPGVRVTVSVVTGDISSPYENSVWLTGSSGLVWISVGLGDSPGDIVLRATVEGLPPVDFQIYAVSDPTATRPTVTGGVFGAPWSATPLTAISAGGLVTVYGQAFSEVRTAKAVAPKDLVDGRLPTSLAEVCVLMNAEPAFPLFVSGNQINVQVPTLGDAASAEVRVVRKCGMPDESISLPTVIPVWPVTPEFFYWTHLSHSSGLNAYPVAAVNPITQVRIGPPGILSGIETVPAKPGDVIDLYATGFGPTEPYLAPGDLPNQLATVVNPVQVLLGTSWIGEEDILYAGLTQWAGVYLLRIRTPTTLADGYHPLSVYVGDVASPDSAFLTVAR